MSNKALGKGLSALIGDTNIKNITTKTISEQKLIPTHIIHASNLQPRKTFNEDDLKNLVKSIEKDGILQPLIVRKSDNNSYEIVAGERRWRAAIIAEIDQVPVIIKNLNDDAVLRIAIIENIQRQDLNVIEEADGYKKLISEFNYTQERIAEELGKSRSHIANLLRLLTLPQSIIELVKNNTLSFGHARALINIENAEELAHIITSKKLSVRQTEQLIKNTKIDTVNKTKKIDKNTNNQKSTDAIQILKKSLYNNKNIQIDLLIEKIINVAKELKKLSNEVKSLEQNNSTLENTTSISWIKDIDKIKNIVHNLNILNILNNYNDLDDVIVQNIEYKIRIIISEQNKLYIALNKFNTETQNTIIQNIHTEIEYINTLINNDDKNLSLEKIHIQYIINKLCNVLIFTLNYLKIPLEKFTQNNKIYSNKNAENFESTV